MRTYIQFILWYNNCNMSELMKFLSEGKRVNNLSVPIDIQKDSNHHRIVVGFATLDNIDLTNEMITEEANINAFREFRGNVRFMHEKRPVGKVIDYHPATYYDPKTDKIYRGIQVAVSVSEGAEDVWKMCQDGTINGFSVGGSVKKAAPEFLEDFNKTVRVIHEYQLLELSLVDSPANQLANVQTIYKSIDGAPEDDSVNMCGSIQKVLEITTEGDNPQVTVKKSNTPAHVSETEIEKSADDVQPKQEVVESKDSVEKDADESNEAVNESEAAEIQDGESSQPTLQEAIQDLSRQIAEQTETVSKDVTDKIAVDVNDQIASVKKEFDARFTQLEEDAQKNFQTNIADISQRIADLETGIEETRKSLDEINEGTAVRKSLDEVQVTEVESDSSPFAGVFSSKYE